MPFSSISHQKDKKLFNKFRIQKGGDIQTNLIIIGDSDCEMKAGQSLHKNLSEEREHLISDKDSHSTVIHHNNENYIDNIKEYSMEQEWDENSRNLIK